MNNSIVVNTPNSNKCYYTSIKSPNSFDEIATVGYVNDKLKDENLDTWYKKIFELYYNSYPENRDIYESTLKLYQLNYRYTVIAIEMGLLKEQSNKLNELVKEIK